MKSTDKNSPQNKKKGQSDDTLLYVLLFVLFIVLVGCLVWQFWPGEQKWNHDYVKTLGKKESFPTAKEVSQLVSNNWNRLKTAKRILEGRMVGRKLKKERKEIENEIKNVEESSLKSFRGFEIEDLRKHDPELFVKIYSDLYEQGKATVRLKDKTSPRRPREELEKQLKIQEEWNIPKEEEEQIDEEIKKWIHKWYWQARGELIDSGKHSLLTENVVPLWDEGRKIEGEPTRDQINKYKKKQTITCKDENGEKYQKTTDFSKDLNITFDGYYGFLTEEDKKDSTEGSETFGLTKSHGRNQGGFSGSETGEDAKYDEETKEIILPVPKGFHLVNADFDNHRRIEIGFEKKLFLNRLGYEQWIINLEDKGSSFNTTYHDICFNEVVETMAHELAHAIVNTIEKFYEGEEGGGHGRFFYEIMDQIEEMIKKSSDFKDFETWWKKPRKEQKELAIDSILVAEKGHWEKNKWWYIGGVGVLAVGGLMVLILWDGGQSSSKKKC